MNIIFDLYHNSTIREARHKATGAQDEIIRLRAEVEDLRRQTDSFTLAVQALWELLRNEARLSDAELVEKIQEVDLRDGEADGRISASVVGCTACGRRSRSTRRRCVYCGNLLPTPPVLASRESNTRRPPAPGA